MFLTMTPDTSMEDLGREVVADGRLRDLRQILGLTRNAMAELLHTAPLTYSSWELRPVNLHRTTAERIGRFYTSASRGLELLRDDGLEVQQLMPFHMVATHLGIPQEQLHRRYREGEFTAIDAGILGLWINRADLEALK